MCAILDANVAHEVRGRNRSPASEGFFEWIDSGKGKLIVGGKLREELYKAGIGEWLQQAALAGNVRSVDDREVDEEAQELQNQGSCRSDDHHVIALARVGGARLLYSNDKKLHKDFGNGELIDNPRGKIYTIIEGREKFVPGKQRLLRETGCPM